MKRLEPLHTESGLAAGTEVLSAIAGLRLLPVVVIHEPDRAAPLGRTLKLAGLPCAEVTFRTPAAAEAISELVSDPELLVGAGTVLTVDQVHRAVDAGAAFVVTPGFSAEVVAACRQRKVPVIPGVATATEIQMALEAGVEVVKLFPAEAIGGVRTLGALSAPFPQVRFIPTGGITGANLTDYLRHRAVLAVGGSWIVEASLLKQADFQEIGRRTAEAVRQIKALDS